MANTWGRSGTTWGQGLWGEQDNNTVTLTGLSSTLSLGDLITYPEQGWGRDAYGEEPYGDSYDPNVIIETGFGLTSSLGSITTTEEINAGWGQDGWGVENWGQSGLTLELTAPDGLTASLPAVGWGDQAWSADKWGGEYCLDPADVMGLTGVGATSSTGSPTVISDLTGILSGQSATSSVGAISPADVMGLTGVGATSSVGAITPDDMAIGLAGVSVSASPGAISPTEMSIGLTGQSATVSLGQIGGPIAWQKITPSQGGSWSEKTATQGGSWSKITPP